MFTYKRTDTCLCSLSFNRIGCVEQIVRLNGTNLQYCSTLGKLWRFRYLLKQATWPTGQIPLDFFRNGEHFGVLS